MQISSFLSRLSGGERRRAALRCCCAAQSNTQDEGSNRHWSQEPRHIEKVSHSVTVGVELPLRPENIFFKTDFLLFEYQSDLGFENFSSFSTVDLIVKSFLFTPLFRP